MSVVVVVGFVGGDVGSGMCLTKFCSWQYIAVVVLTASGVARQMHVCTLSLHLVFRSSLLLSIGANYRNSLGDPPCAPEGFINLFIHLLQNATQGTTKS